MYYNTKMCKPDVDVDPPALESLSYKFFTDHHSSLFVLVENAAIPALN